MQPRASRRRRRWSPQTEPSTPASSANPGHGERTVAEVRRLLQRGLPALELAVITPYQAQVAWLRDQLQDELTLGLEVGTVDGFQGREKEAVIVDLVRSNDAGEIGFLSEVRRSHVALTRARRLLIVLLDGATLQRHNYYEHLLAAAEAQGSWLSAWSDDAPPLDP